MRTSSILIELLVIVISSFSFAKSTSFTNMSSNDILNCAKKFRTGTQVFESYYTWLEPNGKIGIFNGKDKGSTFLCQTKKNPLPENFCGTLVLKGVDEIPSTIKATVNKEDGELNHAIYTSSPSTFSIVSSCDGMETIYCSSAKSDVIRKQMKNAVVHELKKWATIVAKSSYIEKQITFDEIFKADKTFIDRCNEGALSREKIRICAIANLWHLKQECRSVAPKAFIRFAVEPKNKEATITLENIVPNNGSDPDIERPALPPVFSTKK